MYSILLLTAESLALSVALLVEAYASPLGFYDRVNHNHHLHHALGSQMSLGAIQGLLLASAAVLLGIVAMITQLGVFHVSLMSKGLTTYDFIVLEQKKQREKETRKLQGQVSRQKEQYDRDKALADSIAASAASNAPLPRPEGGEGGVRVEAPERKDEETGHGLELAVLDEEHSTPPLY